jgi:hypothetical protein
VRLAGGWIRIYLFYGLIFFMLGLAGSLLGSGWGEEPRMGRGFTMFRAELGKYMNSVIPGNDTMMVMADRSRYSLRLLYPAGATGDWGGITEKMRGLLGETYYPVIVERFDNSGDYQRLWSRWSEVEPDQVGMGLNLIPVGKRQGRYRVQLGLAFPVKLRGITLEQMENVLGGIPSYTLRQIRRGDVCRQDYHWDQSGDWETVLMAVAHALAAIPDLGRPGI